MIDVMEGLTIGFFGTGAVDQAVPVKCIDAGGKQVRWIFVLTSDEFTQGLADFATVAKENGIPYEVITKTDDEAHSFNEVADHAARIYHVEDPLLQLETILTESNRSGLFVLWDDERDEELERVVGCFIEAGIKCFQVGGDGLTLLGVEGEARWN